MSERNIKRLFLTLLMLPFAVFLAGQFVLWLMVRLDISYIESHVELPEEAYAVDQYERFYIRKGEVILAEYVSQPYQGRNRNIFWILSHSHVVGENGMPNIADGGCGVVTFQYDVKRKAISQPGCNGEA